MRCFVIIIDVKRYNLPLDIFNNIYDIQCQLYSNFNIRRDMTFKFFNQTSRSISKKPNKKQNFFQNYFDHLLYLEQSIEKDVVKVLEKNDLFYLVHTLARHITVFDPLRDGYDYFDEVMGASVAPMALNIASAALLSLALFEGAIALGIQVDLFEQDQKMHVRNGALYMIAAFLTSVLSFVILMKSLASLITRPAVTAFQGYQEQDIPRFL
jgi:hypothetical protein